MAAPKTVWGIDLGQVALKALRLRSAGDRVEVVDHVYIEHSRILSQPDADRQALISEAMKKFTARHDLSRETLVVGVPGQHTLARFSKLPPVPKKSKIPELVKYEAQQQIPFDMDEVIWDYQTFEDPQGTSMETQVGIFAMRRELLRSHLLFLSSLDLEPALVQSAPLALYNALKYDGITGSEPVTILDIGAQNTDLIVVEGDSLWTRNIPIGGNNFTEALLKTFKLSFNKAENLKRTAASSKYARQIFQAMRPVFADLVAEVQRSIGYFSSQRRGVKLNKLVAMGNAFKLPGMVKFVQQNLGMEVVRPTTFNKLVIGDAPNAPELMDQLLSYGVAYGLALQGLGKAQITSNLLPPEIAKQVVWRRKTPWFYGAAACLALAAGLVWGRNVMDAKAVEQARGGENPPSPPTFNVQYAPNDPEQKNPLPDPQALTILRNGPSDSNPLAYAQAVAEAGKHLEQVRGLVESKNQEERQKAKGLRDLQLYKPVWPNILQMVHAALPATDADLNRALQQGPEAYKKLIESDPGRYARGKRQVIFIEKFDAQFSTDLATLYASIKEGRQGAPSMAGTTPTGTPLKGFLLTITGSTPNERGFYFVNDTFVSNLRKAVIPGLYFDGVHPMWQREVKNMTGGYATPTATPYGIAGGMRAGGGMPRQLDASRDPVTNEPMLNDTKFEIILMAVLGEKPAPAPAGGTAADPGAGVQ